MHMPKKTIEQRIDELAQMTQRGFVEINNQLTAMRRNTVTKHELRDTEEHLLDAISGIEVRRRDFEALTGVVEDLVERIAVLEKRR